MKKFLLIFLIAVILLVLGFFAFNSYIYNKKQGNITDLTPIEATLTGEYVCLPHKDTSGPQTLECAFGIKSDENIYYALDWSKYSQGVPEINVGERFSALGMITPVQMLSTDYWNKYPIAGIFSVLNFFKKI